MKTPRHSRTLKILGLTLSSALSAVSVMPQTAMADTQNVPLVTERRILAEEVTAAAFSCFVWGDPARGLTSVMNQLYRDIYGHPARFWAPRRAKAVDPCHNGLFSGMSYYSNYYLSNAGVFTQGFGEETVQYNLPGRSFITGMHDGSYDTYEYQACVQKDEASLTYTADAIPFENIEQRSMYGQLMGVPNGELMGDPTATGTTMMIKTYDRRTRSLTSFRTRSVFPKLKFTSVPSADPSVIGTPNFADHLQLEMPTGTDSNRLQFQGNHGVAPFSIDVQAYKSCLQSEMNRISGSRSTNRALGQLVPNRP